MSAQIIALTTAPWPIPLGWRFVQEAPEEMPSIERKVGNYLLIVGDDDGEWRWWLCPLGSYMSVAKGDGFDMITAICQCLDALATRLEKP